jgi:hypothetical protein
MSRDFSIRVAVGEEHGRRSAIWKIFSSRKGGLDQVPGVLVKNPTF